MHDGAAGSDAIAVADGASTGDGNLVDDANTANAGWSIAIGSAINEYGYDVGVDTAGNAYVAGPTLLTKVSPQGSILWSLKNVGIRAIGRSVAVADNGTATITGYLEGSGSINGISSVVPPKYKTLFVAQVTTLGKVNWLTLANPSAGSSQGRRVRIDAAGNAYVLGSFAGTVEFGARTPSSSKSGFLGTKINNNDIFLVQVSPKGALQWAVGSTVTSTQSFPMGMIPMALAVGPTGAFIGGHYSGGIVAIGGHQLSTPTGQEIYVAKVSAGGSVLWLKTSTTSKTAAFFGLGADASGNAYFTGFYEGTMTFGNKSITSGIAGVGTSLCTAKIGGAGNVDWASTLTGPYSTGLSIWVTPSGESYLLGAHNGVVQFGATGLPGGNSPGLFVGRVSTTGAFVAARTMQSPITGSGFLAGVALDGSATYAVGSFKGTSSFVSKPLVSNGGSDAFLWRTPTP